MRKKVLAVGMIRFANATVGRDFQWRDVERPEKTDLDVEFAKVGSLHNESRPEKLRAAGFVYEQIDKGAGLDAKTQLGWLARVPAEHFSTQPFEQLAKVLRGIGLENDRREVLIKKNEAQAKRLHWSRDLEWLWYGLFGKVIGYGYVLGMLFISACS